MRSTSRLAGTRGGDGRSRAVCAVSAVAGGRSLIVHHRRDNSGGMVVGGSTVLFGRTCAQTLRVCEAVVFGPGDIDTLDEDLRSRRVFPPVCGSRLEGGTLFPRGHSVDHPKTNVFFDLVMTQKIRFFRRYNTNSSAFLSNRRGAPFTKRRIRMVGPFPEREMDDGRRSG